MAVIKNTDNNEYKVVLLKSIEHTEPIYVRLVRLSDFSTEDIPVYRLLDEVVHKGKKIINLRCIHNKLSIVNDDGYRELNDIIVIDEFDDNIPNAYSWALAHGALGKKLIQDYSVSCNPNTLSSYRVDSRNKIAWTCSEQHRVYCDIATYFSTKCKCPICEAKENNEILSLKYWCDITNNRAILKAYENAGAENDKDSTKIAWNSKKKVKFRVDNTKIIEATLNQVTAGKVNLGVSGDIEDDEFYERDK